MTISNPTALTPELDAAYSLLAETVATQIEVARRMVANYDRGILAPLDVCWRVSRIDADLEAAVLAFGDAEPYVPHSRLDA